MGCFKARWSTTPTPRYVACPKRVRFRGAYISLGRASQNCRMVHQVMSVLFTTVSDDRSGRKDGGYSGTQDNILNLFKSYPQFGIDKFAFWKWEDILPTPFYAENKKMLDHTDPAM